MAEQPEERLAIGKSSILREHAEALGLPIVEVKPETLTIGEFIDVYGVDTLADALKNGQWLIIDEVDFPLDNSPSK